MKTPGRAGGEPGRRPLFGRMWQAIALLAVMLVALAVFAWQQDGGGEGPLNAIAAAAERTQQEPGGRTTMLAIVSSPVPSESMTIRGHGVYSDDGRSRMVVTVPRTGTGGRAEMEFITDEAVMYVSFGEFDALPGGDEWMKMDFSFAEELDMPVPAEIDAAGELALLEATTGEVRKLGKEEVRGVPTTRYRGTVDVEDHAEQLREEGQEDVASLTEDEGTPLTVEAWIDGDGLMRRMKMLKAQPRGAGEDPMDVDMTIDFYDFGIAPEIELPDEDEVFDATSLLRAEIERREG
jgi:hypothetical protein